MNEKELSLIETNNDDELFWIEWHRGMEEMLDKESEDEVLPE